MKIKSIFLFPGYFFKAFIALAKTEGPFSAFVFLIYENYYHFKYRIANPYLKENLASTKSLSFEKDALENESGSYYLFHLALKKTDLQPNEISFLDIGCGTGRFVSVGIRTGFRFSRGIDLDKAGLQIANQNALLAGTKANNYNKYEIIFQDAGFYVIPEDVNIVYFFNPFGEKTMHHVVNNIVRSFQLNPRNIYIIYTLPKLEYLFLNAGFDCIYTVRGKKQKSLSVLKLNNKNSSV